MDWKRQIIRAGKALLLALALTIALLMAMAWVLYRTDLSGVLMHAMVVVVYLASCLMGGLVMAKNQEKRRFLWGAGFGVLYFLVLVLASAVMPGEMKQAAEVGERVRVLLICMLSGMAGGMIS